ncbi:MAG: hypothetical protein ACXWLB_22275 [Reyranella sp.]
MRRSLIVVAVVLPESVDRARLKVGDEVRAMLFDAALINIERPGTSH